MCTMWRMPVSAVVDDGGNLCEEGALGTARSHHVATGPNACVGGEMGPAVQLPSDVHT